jgi:hypothetical protein
MAIQRFTNRLLEHRGESTQIHGLALSGARYFEIAGLVRLKQPKVDRQTWRYTHSTDQTADRKDFVDNFFFSFRTGSNLLHVYDNSVSKMLQAVYPTHKWDPWMFARASR